MSTNKDIMEAAAHLKELLVRDQKYDAAKDVRDIERAYLEKVNTEPATGERVYTAEQQLINVGNAVKCIEEGQELIGQRLEKLEKAVAESERKHGLKSYFDTYTADKTRALYERVEKMEKMEKALSEHMAEHRSSHDPAQVLKVPSDFGNIKAAKGESWRIRFDPTDSPKDIPFSVALEYLKMGREVARPHWKPDRRRIQAQGIGGVGGMYVIVGASLNAGPFRPDTAEMVATDWMVLPEEKKP